MSNDKNRIPQQFIVRINTRDDDGASRAREFITFAGLLAVAHEIGLDAISTKILQMPTDANGQTAVVRAVARGKPGVFTGLGDACPGNVNKKVARHLLRVAETRAKARALRDLCNINMLALEELGDDDDFDVEPVRPAQQRQQHAQQQHHSQQRQEHRREEQGSGISDAQKRALWRKALTLGHEGPAAQAFLAERLGVDPAKATREQASKLLDALSEEERRRENGGASHAAE